MRRIEQNMLDAVRGRRNWEESNTRVQNDKNGTAVYLHENLIFVRHNDGRRVFTLAGWNTTTTRSRLRALGVDVRQRAGRAIYDGAEIDSYRRYDVK